METNKSWDHDKAIIITPTQFQQLIPHVVAGATGLKPEQAIITELQRKILSNRRGDIRMDRYYEGRQRLDVLDYWDGED